jgi:purine-nucleoside phosphorylase
MSFRDGDCLDHGEDEVQAAADFLAPRFWARPQVALALGSGLGNYAEQIERPVSVPFGEVPGFPESTVPGHAGRLVFGERAGVPVVVQSGRFHVYEGIPAARVAFPVRVLHALGVRSLVVMNAAGALGSHLRPGDLLVLEDHLHLQFRSPLRGRGPLVDATRFVDLSRPYAPRLIDLALDTALRLGIPRVVPGVYTSVLGPAYETAAEVSMLRFLGGDAVGMSTVPEVLTARHLDMEVLGLSAITNLAAGVGKDRLTHQDVLRIAGQTVDRLTLLLDAVLPKV